MATRFVLLVFILILCSRLTAQNIVIDWQNCFDSPYGDRGEDIAKTESGYLILSTEKADYSSNCWLIKVDTNGNFLWQKIYGGASADESFRIQASTYGNYYLIATTFSADGDITYDPYSGALNFWIVKIDAQGNKLWDKVVGGNCREYVMDGVATPDGGVVAMGYSCSTDGDITHNYGGLDIWAFKLDSTGTKVWDFTLGSSGLEAGFRIIATTDGGFLLSGAGMMNTDGNISCTPHSDKYEALLVKLDSNGIMQWQRCYGGSEDDFLQTIIEVSDGYILGGGTKSDDGDMEGAGYHPSYSQNGSRTTDIWVAKIDLGGNMIWNKCYGGSSHDDPSRIFKTENNNYMIFGSTTSFDGDVSGNHSLSDAYYEIWVLKVSASGEILYQRCIGGNASENISSGVVQKNDTTYVVAATAQGPNTGDLTCGPPVGDVDFFVWAFEFTDTTLYTHATSTLESGFKVFPNPASEYVVFESTGFTQGFITITDMYGRESDKLVLDRKQVILNTSNYKPGMYIYTTKYNDRLVKGKFIIGY